MKRGLRKRYLTLFTQLTPSKGSNGQLLMFILSLRFWLVTQEIFVQNIHVVGSLRIF